MKINKVFAGIAALLLLSVSAQAWEFPFKPVQSNTEQRWNGLVSDLSLLNTPGNIKLLNEKMESNRVYAVGIYVIDLKKPLWVVYNKGVTTEQFDAGINFRLTEGQVRQVRGMVEDGSLSWFEMLRLRLLLRN